MNRRPRIALGGLLCALLLIGGAWFGLAGRGAQSDPSETMSDSTSGGTQSERSTSTSIKPVAPRETEPVFVPPTADSEPSLFDELFPTNDPAWAWSRVDLDALRDEFPDNRAFELVVPTDDPRVLQHREETRARWNQELGKVLSNTGSEEDVRAFYAERQRVSSDYVVFTGALLERYADVLPAQDIGLLTLAQRMHRARLEELPRKLAEAVSRRDAHEIARNAWLADQAAFSNDSNSDPEPDFE